MDETKQVLRNNTTPYFSLLVQYVYIMGFLQIDVFTYIIKINLNYKLNSNNCPTIIVTIVLLGCMSIFLKTFESIFTILKSDHHFLKAYLEFRFEQTCLEKEVPMQTRQ